MAKGVSKELRETQKLVKDAATSVRKAADRAAKVARKTGVEIGRSKEYKTARKEAQLALKAISATARIALEAISAAAKTLGDSKEVKRASTRTKAAARSTVKTGKAATTAARKSATAKAKSSAKTARTKASSVKKKSTAKKR